MVCVYINSFAERNSRGKLLDRLNFESVVHLRISFWSKSSFSKDFNEYFTPRVWIFLNTFACGIALLLFWFQCQKALDSNFRSGMCLPAPFFSVDWVYPRHTHTHTRTAWLVFTFLRSSMQRPVSDLSLSSRGKCVQRTTLTPYPGGVVTRWTISFKPSVEIKLLFHRLNSGSPYGRIRVDGSSFILPCQKLVFLVPITDDFWRHLVQWTRLSHWGMIWC